MWNCPEYLPNLHGSAFIQAFHQFEGSWFGKYLHFFYVKSNGCLLIHWVLMASILFNIAGICNSQIKCNYLKSEKIFLAFLYNFLNLHQILNIWKKNIMVIANVFSKLQTVKNIVTPLFKKRCFGTRLDSRHVKVFRILEKSVWKCFYHVFSSIWRNLISNISPLVLGEIWVVFVNTLTADCKYPVQYCKNLQLPIQMQLSEKQKNFLNFLFHFWNSPQILNIFFKKRWRS